MIRERCSGMTDMEMAGIRVDRDFLKEMSKSLEIRLSEIEKDIYAGVGYEFNINSTQQLSRAIFETLKLEPPGRKKKTTSGLYSTSADVLEEMRGSHPIIDLILEHRELSKLKNTYVDALPLTINHRTGVFILLSSNRRGNDVWHLLHPICRIFRLVPNWAGRFGQPSSPIPIMFCFRWITARSNYGLWLIWLRMKEC